jgi:hypothetical protein
VIHHVSLNVRDPQNAARALSAMLDGTARQSPTPPFPDNSWVVYFGDQEGSSLEILPWGSVLDPDTEVGIGFDPQMRPRTGSHVLVRTPHLSEDIRKVAEHCGWRCGIVRMRSFEVAQVWIENTVLVEFLPEEFLSAYATMFGRPAEAIRPQPLRIG